MAHGLRKSARRALYLVAAGCLALFLPQEAPAQNAVIPPAAPSAAASATALSFIETLYQQEEWFRAESAQLRFLFDHPRDEAAGAVLLARAKLYYRQARFEPSRRIALHALSAWDSQRIPAAQLASFAMLHEGAAPQELERILPQTGWPMEPTRQKIQQLHRLHHDQTRADQARQWQTWLPGSGFFVLEAPARGTLSVAVHLFLLGVGVHAWQAGNHGATLAFGLAEIAFYRGGIKAVTALAQKQRQRRYQKALDTFLQEYHEPALLERAFPERAFPERAFPEQTLP